MASKLYPAGIAAAMKAAIDWDATDKWKVVLVKGTLSYNAAHDFYDDISASIVDSEDPKLLDDFDVTVSTTTVKFDATDPVAWTSVDDADDVGAAVVYYDTGNAATSPLFSFNDGTDLTTNGSDVTLEFNASGIGTLDLS